MKLKVFKECCKNCLLSKDRIVDPKRAKEIISHCAKKQVYFVCHIASMNGEEIVCKKFFDSMGHVSQLVRIAERLNALEFVDQPKSDKLPSFEEMKPSFCLAP
jgi:hypothetical protein